MNIIDTTSGRNLVSRIWIIILCAIIGLSGCSSESSSLNEEVTDPNADNLLSNICTDWFSSPSDVDKKMEGYTQVSSTSEFSIYTTLDNSFDFGYSFINDKLVSAVALFPISEDTEANEVVRKYKLDSYTFMGNINGYNVYMDDMSNTMATVSNKTLQNIDYIAIGFAPINGNDILPNVRPITVETLAATSITANSMVLNGKFDCDDEVTECRFLVSTNQDMSESKSYKASKTGNTFTYSLNKLSYNTTVYFKAQIISEGETYNGDIISAELEKMPTYSIGDFYPNASNPEGVVCAIKDGGVHGTIISLDQDYLKWDNAGIFCYDYKSYNKYDGSANEIGSSQPFHKWIRSHGDGWFGPAMYQLEFSHSNLEKINSTLKSKGFTILNGTYWSSTQRDCNTAWVVTVTETGYMGYSNQYSFYNSKDQVRNTKAMKYF